MEWSPEFCLVCDRQTDGGIYCGEACRLAEYEKANSASEASSPISPGGFPTSWPSTSTNKNVSPFANVSRGFEIPPRTSCSPISRPYSSSIITSVQHSLTPSSSQSSITSLQSSSSIISISPDSSQLSDQACRELRAYAGSFDQSRYQRRQST